SFAMHYTNTADAMRQTGMNEAIKAVGSLGRIGAMQIQRGGDRPLPREQLPDQVDTIGLLHIGAVGQLGATAPRACGSGMCLSASPGRRCRFVGVDGGCAFGLTSFGAKIVVIAKIPGLALITIGRTERGD